MIRVSLVVTTVDDDGGRLPVCLMYWTNFLYFHKYAELIIVNDGGPAGFGGLIQEIVKEEPHDRIKLLYLNPPDSSFRLAAARNLGVKHARATDRIVFTDSDCIPGENLIPMHKNLSKSNSFGIGFRKRIKGEIARDWIENPLIRPSEQELDKLAWRDDERFGEGKPPGWRGCEHVWGCNFSVPIEPFLEAGGFDESIQGWGGEDINLADRLMRHKGLTLSVLRGCYVYHMDHPARAERSPHPFGERGKPLVANGGPLVRNK